MKPGDLVKYKPYPHKELQHFIGLMMSMDDAVDQYGRDELNMGWVMWGINRPRGLAGTLLEEYLDELEVIDESSS